MRLLAVGAFVATLHIIYVRWISPLFNYRGFGDHAAGFGDWLLLACVLGFFTITLPADLKRPTRFVSWWLFLTLVVPVTLIPLYQPGDVSLEMWGFAVMAGAATTLFGRLDRLPRLRSPSIRLSEKAFIGLLLAFTALVMVWALATLPVTIKLVWLTDIRDQRSAFSEAVGATSRPFGYLIRWQSAAVFPALLAIGLDRSRPHLVVFAAAGLVLFYAMTGYKQVLLSLVFVPATYYVLRRPKLRVRPATWLAGGLVVSSWFAVVLDQITNSIDFTSIFVRRAVILSGIYTSQYVSYFSQNGSDLFSHSILAGITHSPYDVGPPLTIARAFYGVDFSANANFMADAFANLGYPGVLIMICVVGAVLYLVNSFTDDANVPAVGAMLVVPTTSLANSAASSTITTHGLGLAVLLIMLYPLRPKK